MIKFIKIWPVAFLIPLMMSGASSAIARTNQNVNRARPPKNTSQYVKEAERVRLLKMGELLGLSEEQLLKWRKAQLKKDEKFDKEEERLKKARAKFEKEQQAAIQREGKLVEEYEAEIEKILTPEQYKGYRLLRQKELEPLKQIEPSNPETPGPQKNDGGSIGPLVKVQDPPMMYE